MLWSLPAACDTTCTAACRCASGALQMGRMALHRVQHADCHHSPRGSTAPAAPAPCRRRHKAAGAVAAAGCVRRMSAARWRQRPACPGATSSPAPWEAAVPVAVDPASCCNTMPHDITQSILSVLMRTMAHMHVVARHHHRSQKYCMVAVQYLRHTAYAIAFADCFRAARRLSVAADSMTEHRRRSQARRAHSGRLYCCSPDRC